MAIKNKISRASKVLNYLLVLLLASVIILGLNSNVWAANPTSGSTGVQAQIPSNPPTVAATITFPSNNQTITTLPLKVGGTCSGDVLVKVFSNGVFVGSTQCVNGTYSMSIDLFTGKNDIVARVYDALNQAGPDSKTTTVTFTPTGFNTSGPRVSLTSDYAKRGANPNEDLTWPIILSGGTAPYAVSIDWGDGTTELVSRSSVGEIDLSHKYEKPGVYTVIIKVTDANGNSAFLQLVAVANGALAQDNQTSSDAAANTRVVILWWPILVAAALVIFSFWLGARSKLESLRKQAEKRVNY